MKHQPVYGYITLHHKCAGERRPESTRERALLHITSTWLQTSARLTFYYGRLNTLKLECGARKEKPREERGRVE